MTLMESEGSTAAEPPSTGAEPATLSIEIVDDRGTADARVRRWLSERALLSLRPLGCTGEIRARLVDDETMKTAHARWLGVAETTDVLTFDLADSDGMLDVDLLICADEARRQAEARGLPLERELLLYLIHGVLHCLGHDDHDEAGAARMHAEEDRLLEAAGIGATFAVAPSHTMPEREGRVAPAGSRARGTR
jgi:probable rRNA maturation factor